MTLEHRRETDANIYIQALPALKEFLNFRATLVLTPWSLFVTMITLGFSVLLSSVLLVSRAPPAVGLDNGVGRLPCAIRNIY